MNGHCARCHDRVSMGMKFPELVGSPVVCSRCVFKALSLLDAEWAIDARPEAAPYRPPTRVLPRDFPIHEYQGPQGIYDMCVVTWRDFTCGRRAVDH